MTAWLTVAVVVAVMGRWLVVGGAGGVGVLSDVGKKKKKKG